MAYGIQLKVWGDRACFTRPEMKVERMSYDVITPSAARGILEAIHWKPAIRWVVDWIQVLNPIQFDTIRRNEVSSKIPAGTVMRVMKGNLSNLNLIVEDNRQQRSTTFLKDVAYVIGAHFVFTEEAAKEDSEGKHLDIFRRRALKGQCFHTPCLGNREFPAHFILLDSKEDSPIVHPSLLGEKDLGWMLHDIDFKDNMTPYFFRALMKDGLISIPPIGSKEAKA